MVLDERSRHRLFTRLEEVLGSDEASTLMEHLPPVGWAEVATKRDLVVLETKMETMARGIDAAIHRELGVVDRHLTNLVFTAMGVNAAITALAFTASRLL